MNSERVIPWMLLILALFGGIAVERAEACRYSVRDVAFVSFPGDRYRCCLLVDDGTPEKLAGAFESVAYTLFCDSNVEFEVVHVTKQTEHPAVAALSRVPRAVAPSQAAPALRNLPLLLLAVPSQGGWQKAMILPLPNRPDRDALWVALQAVVTTPLREEITRHLVDTLGVVLLIEGEDRERNCRALEVARDAIDRVQAVLPGFPRTINAPATVLVAPRLVVLPCVRSGVRVGSPKEDHVLLWSLGLAERDRSRPFLVVLHGRGRLVGAPLVGDKTDPAALARIVSFIGQDCECSLPRGLLQGSTLPLRWDAAVRGNVAQNLGFDPESPLVKSEIRSIVQHDAAGEAGGGELGDPGMLDIGYRELELSFEEQSESPAGTNPGERDRVGDGSSPGEKGTDRFGNDARAGSGALQETAARQGPESAVGGGGEGDGSFRYTPMVVAVALLLAGILFWGGIVLLRATRRKS